MEGDAPHEFPAAALVILSFCRGGLRLVLLFGICGRDKALCAARDRIDVRPQRAQDPHGKAVVHRQDGEQNVLRPRDGVCLFRLQRIFPRETEDLFGARREALYGGIVLQVALEDGAELIDIHARADEQAARRAVGHAQHRHEDVLAADIVCFIVFCRLFRQRDRLTEMVGKI